MPSFAIVNRGFTGIDHVHNLVGNFNSMSSLSAEGEEDTIGPPLSPIVRNVSADISVE